MAEQKIRTDFNAMIVAELKKCLQEHSISARKSPPRSDNWLCEWVHISKKDEATSSDKSIIYEIQIPNPSFLKTVNNFDPSPPFGLQDIFNHLIYKSTESGRDSSLIK